MIKRSILATAVLAATVATPAFAGVLVTTPGSTASFAAPTAVGGATFTFNVGATNPANFTTTGLTYNTGDSAAGAQPAFSDGSRYLSVTAGNTATLQSSTRYDSVSFFLGSIDSYNTVRILSTTGAVIATFTGSDFTLPANGNQDLPSTNRRITFSREAGDAFIGGISFSSGSNSAEIDNVVFAVPEPSTWALMLAGFGMVGMAMRARRRRTNVVFA